MEATKHEKFLKNRRKLSRIIKRVTSECTTYDDMVEKISEYVLTKFSVKKDTTRVKTYAAYEEVD